MEFLCAGQIWWRLPKSFLICVDSWSSYPTVSVRTLWNSLSTVFAEQTEEKSRHSVNLDEDETEPQAAYFRVRTFHHTTFRHRHLITFFQHTTFHHSAIFHHSPELCRTFSRFMRLCFWQHQTRCAPKCPGCSSVPFFISVTFSRQHINIFFVFLNIFVSSC